jgi:isopentenyl-diphosphate delta-isomerase
MKTEILDLVDENDKVISQVTREKIYKENLSNYRVINVIIFDTQGRIWLPRRTKDKSIFPNCFDFSCGEHVVAGESYQTAALRGLQEELNLDLTETDLKLLGKLSPKDGVSSFMIVYKVVVEKAPKYNEKDFTSASFVSIEQLGEMISDKPEEFKSDWPLVYRLLLLAHKTE